jgi:hypothetical protein
MKDVQATEETFSPQKRTSSTLKHEILHCFLFSCFSFALLDPDQVSDKNFNLFEEILDGFE